MLDESLRHTNNWFNYSDFYTEIASKPFQIFVEVGVWKGHSISFLANLLRDRQNVRIYAVDIFEQLDWPPYKAEVEVIYELYNLNLRHSNTRHLITDIVGCSSKAAEQFEDGTVDFVFIDADRAYESVKTDIQAWLPKVRN